jgi:hypothetical protein
MCYFNHVIYRFLKFMHFYFHLFLIFVFNHTISFSIFKFCAQNFGREYCDEIASNTISFKSAP